MSNVFHKDFVDDDLHALPARTYADITARDADTAFNTDAANINKAVRVDSPAQFFVLFSIAPLWLEMSNTESDTLAEILTKGNTTGGTDLIVSTGDDLLVADHMTVGSQVAPATDASIDLKATNKAALLNRLTTVQRDALTAISGMTIYNTDANDVEYFNGVTWVSVGGGDVVGPPASTDNAIARFNLATGKLIQNSGATITDAGGLTATDVNIIATESYKAGGFNVLLSEPTLFNVLVGLSTGDSLNTGVRNTAVGHQALINETDDNDQTAVGYRALFNVLNGGGSNTAIGSQAGEFISGGATPNILSNTSVYLGAQTEALASGDANEIVIGFQATGAGPNTVTLGNTSIVTTLLRGNVGINTVIPQAHLTIGSSADGEELLRFNTDRQWAFLQTDTGANTRLTLKSLNASKIFQILTSIDTSVAEFFAVDPNPEVYLVSAGGRVGIGTSNPSAPLEVKTADATTEAAIFIVTSQSGRSLSILQPDIADPGAPFVFATNNAMTFRVDAIDAIKITDEGKVGVNVSGSIHTDAVFQVDSTTLGSLPVPRMTKAQRDAIVGGPADGLLVDNINNNTIDRFNGSFWNPLSATNIVYVNGPEDFPAPSGGVITLDANTTYVLYNDDPTSSQQAVVLTDRIQIPDAGGCRITSAGLATVLLVYTGTGTFLTTSDTFTGFLHIDELFLSVPNGTLFDIDGVLPIGSEFFPRIFMSNMGVFDTDTLGTIKTISVNFNVGAFFSCKQGLILDGIDEALIGDWRFANWQNDSGAVMLTAKNNLRFPKIQNSTFETAANETAFNIGPFVGDETFIITGNSYRGAGNLYATGASGTVTSVSDQTHSGTITAVAGTAFGESIFTDVAHDLAEGEIITQSGFVTETQYNGTFEVLEIIDADNYRLHVAFTATDTGSWTSPRIQFEAVNSLSVGDGVQVTGTADYDAEYRVLGVSGTAFFVNGTFVATDTGNFNTDSLTEKDSVMRVVANAGIPDSRAIGSIVRAGNAAATVISTADTWTDLNLNGAVAGSNQERWLLTNTTTAEQTYDGTEPFDGTALATIVVQPGASSEFQFRVVKNGSPLSDAIVSKMAISGTLTTVALVAPITAVTGDTIRLQVLEVGATDNPTITDLSLTIE